MKKILSIVMLFLMVIINAGCSSEGKLHITSDVTGADIFINDEKKGITGGGVTIITVDEGEHEVRVFKHTKEWDYEGIKKTFVADKSSIEVYIRTNQSPTQYRIDRLEKERIAREEAEKERQRLAEIERKRQTALKKARIKEDFNKYTGNTNGTAYNKKAGLMWMRCSLGQIWNGKTCEGDAKQYTLNKVIELVYNNIKNGKGPYLYVVQEEEVSPKYTFANKKWRLPTISELKTLVHCTTGEMKRNPYSIFYEEEKCYGNYASPTINSLVFPNTPKSYYFSTNNGRSNTTVRAVNFEDGQAVPIRNYGYPRKKAYIRLVRDVN